MPKKKLAIICSRFPYPLNKGDKLRLFHQIKFLSQHFEIYLHAINEEKIKAEEQQMVQQYCKKIYLYKMDWIQRSIGLLRSFIKNEPLQIGYFYSSLIANNIEKRLKKDGVNITYCQLSRTASYGLLFKGPVIFDYQDCFSKNYERAYEQSTGIRKLFYYREWKTMLRYETEINNNFVAKTIISENDKNLLPFASEKIVVVTNGVDTLYYHPRSDLKEFDILFSGNLNYQPNIEAALLIIKELQPLLIKAQPRIKIGIAGNTKNKEILAAANENIIIKNQVADMRDIYAKTHVFIAPLFTGAGLQNKLLEAMSMGIPCVASSVCNAALKAPSDVAILAASEIPEFCRATLKLLQQPGLAKNIGEAGQEFVAKQYSWDKANEKLLQLMLQYL